MKDTDQTPGSPTILANKNDMADFYSETSKEPLDDQMDVDDFYESVVQQKSSFSSSSSSSSMITNNRKNVSSSSSSSAPIVSHSSIHSNSCDHDRVYELGRDGNRQFSNRKITSLDTVYFEGCEHCLQHLRDPSKLHVVMCHTIENCRELPRRRPVPESERLQLPADDSCVYCWLNKVDNCKRTIAGKFNWNVFRKRSNCFIDHTTQDCPYISKVEMNYYENLRHGSGKRKKNKRKR